MKKLLIIIFLFAGITSFAQKKSLSAGYDNLFMQTYFEFQGKNLFEISNLVVPMVYLRGEAYISKRFSVGVKFSEGYREKYLDRGRYFFTARNKIYELNFKYSFINTEKFETSLVLGANYSRGYLFQRNFTTEEYSYLDILYRPLGYNLQMDCRYKLNKNSFIGLNISFANNFYFLRKFYNYSIGFNYGIYL